VSADAQDTAVDDLALVRQAQAGRAEAFGVLVTRHQDAIYNLCWRVCGHREEARDLAQAAFLRAFQALGRFEAKCSFYTWLFRIAANLAISHRRRRRPVLADRSLDDEPQHFGRGRPANDGQDDPVGRLERAETQRLVQSALAQLGDEHRLILVLRETEQMDYQQIGEVLGLPTGTVKSRIHRARVALRDRLLQMGVLESRAEAPESEHAS
jgi:RNA polymerase sigma-70 factor (ECF subfamily)